MKIWRQQQAEIIRQVENAAATVISSLRKDIEEVKAEMRQCNCNKEILQALGKLPMEKGKEKELSFFGKKEKKGWYPEAFPMKAEDIFK